MMHGYVRQAARKGLSLPVPLLFHGAHINSHRQSIQQRNHPFIPVAGLDALEMSTATTTALNFVASILGACYDSTNSCLDRLRWDRFVCFPKDVCCNRTIILSAHASGPT